jgi:phosphotransferase system  glucose/maltose/N-acetylglucosamine-specific IIC component
MSISTALALIAVIDIPGIAVFFWLTKLADDLGIRIETGVVNGIPLSTKYRELLLYQSWVTYAGGAVIVAALGAFLAVEIAISVSEDTAKTLAYATAVVCAIAALGWVTQGTAELLHYRSVLRETKRD